MDMKIPYIMSTRITLKAAKSWLKQLWEFNSASQSLTRALFHYQTCTSDQAELWHPDQTAWESLYFFISFFHLGGGIGWWQADQTFISPTPSLHIDQLPLPGMVSSQNLFISACLGLQWIECVKPCPPATSCLHTHHTHTMSNSHTTLTPLPAFDSMWPAISHRDATCPVNHWQSSSCASYLNVKHALFPPVALVTVIRADRNGLASGMGTRVSWGNRGQPRPACHWWGLD